jgi:hypothetical protein
MKVSINDDIFRLNYAVAVNAQNGFRQQATPEEQIKTGKKWNP